MKKEFRVSSDLSKVQQTSRDLLSFLEPLKLDKSTVFDIRLCFEEALINAMKYGNGLDRNKSVELAVEYDQGKIDITVQDQGKGFKPKAVSDCTDSENLYKPSGRGVHLMHQLMDKVEYNTQGNRVRLVKFLKK